MSSLKSVTASTVAVKPQDGDMSRTGLYVTTPCRSKRYDLRDAYPEPAHVLHLPAGKYLWTHDPAPAYIGSHEWQKYTHPEGKAYYVKGSAPCIITEADITMDDVNKAVDIWASLVLAWAEERGFKLTEMNELFLEPELDTNICDYYFVDHGSRAAFWLEDSDTSELGLQPACSEGHLKLALEENYWKHVEMFCMHLTSGLPRNPLDELMGIYLHGRGDLVTSQTSTFYFTPEVTDVHMRLLKQCQAIPDDPIIYAFVGRLWGYICNYRFQNFHGEDHSRLDCTTRVFEHDEETPSILLRLISTVILFGYPEMVRQQLTVQLVDDFVVERVWSTFITAQMKEWTKFMQWTLVLILTSAVAGAASPVPLITYISLVLSTAGLLLSIALPHRMQSLTEDIDAACAFLTSQKGKMMLLAIVFSLPRAAFSWAAILLAAQALVILFSSVPLPVGIATCVVVPMLALCIVWIMYPVQRLALYTKVTSLKLPQLHTPFWRRSIRLPDTESSDDLTLH